MRRLYVHFYGFILLAVIGLGWSLEQIWRMQADTVPEIPAWVIPFSEAAVEASKYHQSAQSFSQAINQPVNTLMVASVGWLPDQREALANGNAVPLFNSDQQLYLYLQKGPQLWQIGPIGDPAPQPQYWYQAAFVVLLVVLATLWIAPLARDLRRLELQLKRFPKEPNEQLSLPKRSLVSNIGQSFNAMRQQIQHLLGLQRELTRAVSHDLRTPLARLKFAISMRNERGEDLTALAEDVAEMEQLVGTLLDYAKMEGQEELLSLSQVNITELCTNLADKLNTMPGVTIENKLQGSVVCDCDGHYIERAIQNLVVNAKRHASTRVELSFTQTKGTLNIHVDDDGPGIAPEQRKRILDPFVRLESSRSKDSGGVGLGLTIVARIMDWHHGSIEISESPIKGARFTLVLPCRKTV
ncbi:MULTISPECIES: ATP-binding protein [Gammaproteobacteria]|uniref:ATP-binding protein n=1 Tax=Gammaproteobacteria TaxID=1236 RepID=UPI000DD0B113|nr:MULTISPECIES: ATP-binding protein [Gammaproteobacteria]RTE86739.1 two-component sensor histidine kinase [Aliidiomarina sp. B3213]TCZ90707.1 two-component sensor histidine kinase [Lysobacter sp. N42]